MTQYKVILSKSDKKENYSAFIAKIEAADNDQKLRQLELSLDRLYNAGIFSVTEFKRLDNKILEKLAA